jgi:hypothetical protein
MSYASAALARSGRRARLCIPVFLSLASLVFSTALVCRPVPVLASLRLDDASPHAHLWRHIYAEMPACWKSPRIVQVQEVSDADMDRLIAQSGYSDDSDLDDGDTQVDGCYDSGEDDHDPPSITLRESLRGEDAGLVFSHEYGHFVWDTFLSDRQQAQYTHLWQRQKRAGHLVTEYAGDSEEEGFAEAFSFYLRKPDVLQRRDRESWQFLHALAVRRTARSGAGSDGRD